MKRTPADFVDEAKANDPYELDLGGGKMIRPRSVHHFTRDEKVEAARVQVAWFQWHEDNPGKQPASDPKADGYVSSPFDFDMNLRFGKDFPAFWRVWSKVPEVHLRAMIAELDDHYDPEPASEKEKAEADADPDGEAAGK